ncbi:MAG: superinfection immunity protein [Candidatus Korobacteraceae bacterium]
MLRTIASSLAQSLAILLCAGTCFALAGYLVEKHSFDIGPLFLFLLYLLPIGVAALRKHNASLDIIILNLWLGWTLIGWLVALVWACDTDVETAME